MNEVKCFMLIPTGQDDPRGFPLYRREDTGEVAPFLNNGDTPIPVGAMWYADWLLGVNGFQPHDGHVLTVRTPGGTWCVDSICGNCPDPKDRTHHCWPREGTPPNVTVAKCLGKTCSAGGGSCVSGKWHGFLQNGVLIEV